MNAVIAVCIAVLAAIPATALAQSTVETIKFRGKAAFAEWRYVEGDIQTDIAVVWSADSIKTGGTGGSSTTWSPFLSIQIFRTNIVTGDVFISGVGQSENFEFSVAGDLRSAVLTEETIFQDDSTFTFFGLLVDLRWEATGPRQTNVDHVHEIDGEVVYRQVSNGAFRPAVTTGSILLQSKDAAGNVIREEEFLRGPPLQLSGEIQDNKSASLQIVYP